MIWYEGGGEGRRTLVLLHGLGATAAVWQPLARALEMRGTCRWLATDLGGHGASDAQPSYSVGQLAAQLAQLLQEQRCGELLIIGHSLGAYVALALASGWFGLPVHGVLGIGPKIHWPDADVRAARELGARPVRWYRNEEEAWTRYRRVSGLTAEIAPGEECLARGVVRGEEGWRLAQDPRTFTVAGAPLATLAASATARIRLARGEHDPMVSLAELRVHDPQARDIPGAGHNAHVEDPAAVLELLAQLEAPA
ncbi:MAG: alpha/beta hydrolase [Gammaproteobacteria bacterium]|nr:alpha/beta hydrolase [Gammaproteobacteria bacterium]MBV9727741.1 alpha/beta hydrolase [Gammaproteobacteria bacterium]